ncbi:MAG: glycosyltransferase [Mucilaginibacter sp.]|uniref:glycosyltransferase n=1 Tax=Mucilaginibacter sp. TaxID=1882438 RepID=UPI003267A9CB
MISIIISSAKKELLEQVRKNVENTIGVAYEIIAYDNSDGAKGMCQIYNQGIRAAKYNVLCFMHEDIAIKTQNWGEAVVSTFTAREDIGLIGVAGSAYRPITPTSWNGIGSENYYTNLIQCYKFTEGESKHEYRNPDKVKLAPVVCVDGVWFCTTKALASKYMFDESFTGFHVYDIDFSLTIGQEKTVAVTFDVLLEHFSEGSYNEHWLKDTIKLQDKWFHILPKEAEPHTLQDKIRIEKKSFRYFVEQLVKSNQSMDIADHFLWKDSKMRTLSFKLFIKLQYYVLRTRLKLSRS